MISQWRAFEISLETDKVVAGTCELNLCFKRGLKVKKVFVVLLSVLFLITTPLGAGRNNVAKADAQPMWSMVGFNAQETGQCSYDTSSNGGTLTWKFKVEGAAGSPVIGSKGTVYFTNIGDYIDHYLYAVNPDGTLMWKFKIGGSLTPPAVSPNGTIYVQSTDCHLYAVNPDGTLKWTFDTMSANGPAYYFGDIVPLIAPDGTIYVMVDLGSGLTDFYLFAINPDGTSKLKPFHAGGLNGSDTIAVASDGTVYAPTRGNSLNMLMTALTSSGATKWTFTNNDGYWDFTKAALGSDGTAYIGSSHDIQAVNSDGILKWIYKATDTPYALGIASDGTVYASCGDSFSSFKSIVAVNPTGTDKWTFKMDDAATSAFFAISSEGN